MTKKAVKSDVKEVQARIEERLRAGADRATIVAELQREYHDRSALIRLVNSVADPTAKLKYASHNRRAAMLCALYGVLLVVSGLLIPAESTFPAGRNIVYGVAVVAMAAMVHRFDRVGYILAAIFSLAAAVHGLGSVFGAGGIGASTWVVGAAILQFIFGIALGWHVNNLGRKIRPFYGTYSLLRRSGSGRS